MSQRGKWTRFGGFSIFHSKLTKGMRLKPFSRFPLKDRFSIYRELTGFQVLSVRLSLPFCEVYFWNPGFRGIVSARKWKREQPLESSRKRPKRTVAHVLRCLYRVRRCCVRVCGSGSRHLKSVPWCPQRYFPTGSHKIKRRRCAAYQDQK